MTSLQTIDWEPLDPTLTPAQQSRLPTDADVAFYEAHGWYISPPVLATEVLDRAMLGCERFYQGERDAVLPVQDGYSNWQPSDGDQGVRNNEFVSLQSRAIRELVLQPVIGAIAAKLARTDHIRLLDDQLIYKPPHDTSAASAVGWHTDRAYWANCTSDQLLTAWIPFQDCTVDMGPLVVIDRSHTWSNLEHLRGFRNADLTTLTSQLSGLGQPTTIQEVPMTLKRGQVSFHHCWAIHGSYPNRSERGRLAIAVHLQDATNRYRPYWNDQGQEIHLFDGQLCRTLPNGDPDFSDPQIFPLLWSA